jgi:isopenicillin-N N-acyltransferase-like protein
MMRAHVVRGFVVLLLVALAAPPARADKPFRYPEGKHGKGELKYVKNVPVLTVEGTPEEIGAQIGALAGKPLKPKADTIKKELLKLIRLEGAWTFLVKSCNGLLKKFPEDYRKEIDAVAKASGIDRDLIVVANTFPDLAKIGGCSTLVVGPARSASGGLLLGRNWDFAPIAGIEEFGLVTVYRPKGKRAFTSIGVPGCIVSGTVINDAGLAIAGNEIAAAGDGSPRFDPQGVPMTVIMRRIAEECTTVGEAEKLLRSVKRTTMLSLTVCDRKEGAVFEITPKTVAARRSEKGLCYCTNHFVAKGLATGVRCPRFPILEKTREMPKLAVADVARQMHAVNQGPWTVQTMVVETTAMKVHLSMGKGPATAKPLQPLDLTAYLTRQKR